MNVAVGKVQSIEGKFFAKIGSEVVELKVGDSIVEGMIVFGDKNNPPSAHIEVSTIDNQLISIAQGETQLFDSSLVATFENEGGISPKNVMALLDSNIYSDKDEKTNKEDDSVLVEETEAGEKAPQTKDGREADFDARDGDAIDVTTTLRDTTFPTPPTIQGNEDAIPEINSGTTPTPIPTVPPLTPTISINDATVSETDGTITFTVTLSNPSASAVSVDYAAASGTATVGTDVTANDALSGTLNFAAGETSKTITLDVTDDSIYEISEAFNINLTNPTNATIADAQGLGTINDEDATTPGDKAGDMPSISVSSASATEGDDEIFTVSISNPSTQDVSFDLTTATGTAAATDYDAANMQVSTDGGTTWVSATSATIAAGSTSVLVKVPTVQDTIDENAENFTLTATVTAGDTTNASSTGTAILNDNDFTDANEVVSTNEDTTLTGTVLENSIDGHGNTLSVTDFTIGGVTHNPGDIVTITGVGTISIASTGDYAFVPVANYNGAVPTVSYTISSGVSTDTSTLDITVNPVNDAPDALDSAVTMNEDTTYTYTLTDFGYSDVDGDSISAIRIDSLPAMGDLYYNGVLVTATGLEIDVADISSGLLTFKADQHDSGSDEYIDDIGNSTSVGEQSASYAEFDFSVNDGTAWSDTSATMTVDVNAVADAPILSVEGSTVLTETITVDNVGATGYGYSVTAYNADGSVGNISTHTTTPTGFGVAGDVTGGGARGDVTEISYDTALNASEQIVVNFDQDVNSVDVSVAWNASGENIEIAFYNNGVLVDTMQTGGGTDSIDDLGTLQPSGGEMFDEIRFYPPDADDDFLIHSISFNREIVSNDLSVSEGEDVVLDITSSLVDTDGSESLTLAITDVPAGAILSDGTHTFTADATTTSVDVTNWNLTNITFNMPNIDAGSVDYTLNVVATSTEYSNNDSASTTVPVTITVNDVNYVNLQDNTASVDEAAMSTGTDSASAAEIATGNILSDDQIGSNFSLSNVSITNGTTVDTGSNYKVTTAEGNILIVDKATGDYTYTLVNPVTHATGSDTAIDSFTYTVSDGTTDYQASLDVTINDDNPTSTPSVVDLYVEPITTNLSVIVDSSGSMDANDMQLTLNAINQLVSDYSALGSVHINVVEFYDGYAQNTGWVSDTTGITLNGSGGTDIYQGLASVVDTSFGGNQPQDADQSIVYFFGDGDANVNTTAFNNYLPTWSSFVTSGQIDKLFSYSVNTTSVVGDIIKVADNGENAISQDAVNIANISDLAAAVSQTAQLYTEGSLTEDVNGAALIDFGADGGHIASITIGSQPAVAYDAANPVQTIAGEHGAFEINFNTGDYRYVPSTQGSATETIRATVIDNDGDTIDTQILTINVNMSGEVTGGPIITPTDLSVAEDTAQVIGTVIDANGTVVSSSGTANNGTVTIDASGNIHYTPANSYVGEDRVTITATDNDGITSVRTLIVGVNPGDAQAATLVMTLGDEESVHMVIGDDFNTNLGDWTLSNGYQDNGTMRIDGNGDTATNTTAYNFGVANAGQSATISFTTQIDSNWYSHSSDANDHMLVQVMENGSWVTKADIYRDNLDAQTQTINNVVLDANGGVDVRIVNSSNNNNEDLWIDNFSVTVGSGYKYDLSLAATLADGNETLSDVTLTNMPSNITLKDSNGVDIAQNGDGSYSVTLDGNGDSTVTIYSDTQLDPTATSQITASVTSTDGTDTAVTTLGGSGDDTVVYESGDMVDGGVGYDTITLSTDASLDNLDFGKLDNIEEIDMSNSGTNAINNLSLNDVLDMTDTDNTLVIKGDDGVDSVNSVDTTGWTQSAKSDDGTNTTYEYTNDTTSDSITLIVEDQIDNTGM